jgi:hypothetical protein
MYMCPALLFSSPRSSVGLERRTYTQYRSNADVVSSSLTGGIHFFLTARSVFCYFSLMSQIFFDVARFHRSYYFPSTYAVYTKQEIIKISFAYLSAI